MTDALLLYNTEDGRTQLRLRLEDGTVWLTQAEMAELFQTTPQNITQHVRAIYAAGELVREATCKELLHVQTEGERQVRRRLVRYRLEMILAIGYRVRSPRGSQFRRWASTVLQEYLIKGFALDDARLKEPAWDYFDELLERIRDIRASEKRFYQQVRDLFATAADYDQNAETARRFFQTIQNKMLWAVTGQTAAELIVARADAAAPNLGLTSWAGVAVRKADVATAKNYLTADEISQLNRLVSAFLDLAEDRAQRRQQTTMAEWLSFTDQYLTLAERKLLNHAGSISHDQMRQIVDARYARFDEPRREAQRQAAELEHQRELEAELKQLETTVTEARQPLTPPQSRPKARSRKGTDA